MTELAASSHESDRSQSTNPPTLLRHFGSSAGLLPLWIAEPNIGISPAITDVLARRAATGWTGYEIRPEQLIDAFWSWMSGRHGWFGSGLDTAVSPSVGTSIGVLIEQFTDPGDGVILQPPVFTDFKTLIASGGRAAVRSPLLLQDGDYRIDLDDLEAKASDPKNRMLILCSPHNPVGRVWAREELAEVASVCAANDVFVVADEIHADLTLPPHRFLPFAEIAARFDRLLWAATHGPIKTFGLAGVCDTLLVTGCDEVSIRFAARSSQLHLTRNNVFGLAAFEAGYTLGGPWVDDLLTLVARNIGALADGLPDRIDLIAPQGTYMAWLDLRGLGLDVPEIPGWLGSSAGLALSPGHWFGREGAGFARMSIAAPTGMIEQAVGQLTKATAGLD